MTRGLDFRAPSPASSGPPRRWAQRLGSAAWLLFVWIAVRGSLSAASVLSGLLVIAATTALLGLRSPASSARHRFRPLWALRYLVHFAVEVVRANVEVALAVLFPSRVEHTRAIVEVPLPRSSRLVGAILANAVSLTPGTSIIEVSQEPPAFHVHVLNLSSPDRTRSSIAELHWRLVAAIGPAEALGRVMSEAAELRRRVASEPETSTTRSSDALPEAQPTASETNAGRSDPEMEP